MVDLYLLVGYEVVYNMIYNSNSESIHASV
jgi:hypothetical protein